MSATEEIFDPRVHEVIGSAAHRMWREHVIWEKYKQLDVRLEQLLVEHGHRQAGMLWLPASVYDRAVRMFLASRTLLFGPAWWRENHSKWRPKQHVTLMWNGVKVMSTLLATRAVPIAATEA